MCMKSDSESSHKLILYVGGTSRGKIARRGTSVDGGDSLSCGANMDRIQTVVYGGLIGEREGVLSFGVMRQPSMTKLNGGGRRGRGGTLYRAGTITSSLLPNIAGSRMQNT
jgi:hypothetical protein